VARISGLAGQPRLSPNVASNTAMNVWILARVCAVTRGATFTGMATTDEYQPQAAQQLGATGPTLTSAPSTTSTLSDSTQYPTPADLVPG
jgi:hypothetical protein